MSHRKIWEQLGSTMELLGATGEAGNWEPRLEMDTSEGDIALIGIAPLDTKMVLIGHAVWIQIAGGNFTKLCFFSPLH